GAGGEHVQHPGGRPQPRRHTAPAHRRQRAAAAAGRGPGARAQGTGPVHEVRRRRPGPARPGGAGDRGRPGPPPAAFWCALAGSPGPDHAVPLVRGEDYDARLEPGGWLTPDGAADEGWVPVAVLGGPADGPPPWQRRAAPVRVVEVLDPVQVHRHEDCLVLDLGRNIAGVPRVQVDRLAPGASVVLRPAEYLDEAGRVDQRSTGWPIRDTFTSAGHPATWQPRFVYHGFQYLQVTQRDAAGEVVTPD